MRPYVSPGQLADSATFFMVYLSILLCFQLPFKELTRAVPIAVFAAKQAASFAAEQAQKQAAFVKGQAQKLQAIDGTKQAPDPEATVAAAEAREIEREIEREVDSEVDSVQVPEEVSKAPPLPPLPPPEPFDYPVVWSKVMLATTLGICYSSIQPVTIVFAFAYLMLSYILYARGLLYSYTHSSESRGAFWPAASARLMTILFFAQLMLTGVHYIKQNLYTASAIAITMPLTYVHHKRIIKRLEPQLAVLPLISSAGADLETESQAPVDRLNTTATASLVRLITSASKICIAPLSDSATHFCSYRQGLIALALPCSSAHSSYT